MAAQFVADFEAYMPAEFNDEPYGKTGLIAVADKAALMYVLYFPADCHLIQQKSTPICSKKRKANHASFRAA